jgi:two-component system chemotaxis response regulator CheB
LFSFEKFSPEVIVIGASTGGPDALCKLLGNFPQLCPPVVVVQHISYEFAEAFAERLSHVSGLPLGQIGTDHKLERGHLYLAKGDYHLEFFESTKSGLCLRENNDGLVNGHRPSVDTLFTSLAKAHVQAMSVLLTGMGQDGANGMLELSMRGQTYNLAQDEESSVVFGMPKKAIDNGSVSFVGNIFELRNEILKRLGR